MPNIIGRRCGRVQRRRPAGRRLAGAAGGRACAAPGRARMVAV